MRLVAYKKLIVVTFLLISSYNLITPFSLQNRIINPLLQGSYTCISLPFYYLKIFKPDSPVYHFYNGILLQCFTKLCPEKLKCEIVKRIIFWTLSDNTFHYKISIWIMPFLNHLNNLRFTNNLYDTVNYYQNLSTIFTPKERLKIISNAILNNTISQNNSDWVATFLEDIVNADEISSTFYHALLSESYKHPHILKLCAPQLSQRYKLRIIQNAIHYRISQKDLNSIAETLLKDIKSIEAVLGYEYSIFSSNLINTLSNFDYEYPSLLRLCSPKISQENRLRIIANRIWNKTISQNDLAWIEPFLEDIDSIEAVEGDDKNAFDRRFFRKALIKDSNKNPFLLKLCAPKLSQPSRLEIIGNIIISDKTISQNDLAWIETFLEDIDSIEEVGHNFTDTVDSIAWDPYGCRFKNLLIDHGYYKHPLLLKLCGPKLSQMSRLEIIRAIILRKKFPKKDLALIEHFLKNIHSNDTISQKDLALIETLLADINSIGNVYRYRNLDDRPVLHKFLITKPYIFMLCGPALPPDLRLKIIQGIIMNMQVRFLQYNQKDLAMITILLKDINSNVTKIKSMDGYAIKLHYNFINLLITMERKRFSGFSELYGDSLNYQTKLNMLNKLIDKEKNHDIFAKMATFCLKGYTDYKNILESPIYTKLFLKYGDNPINLINYAIPSLSLKQRALYSFQKSKEYELIKNYNATVLINEKPIDLKAIKRTINHSYIETWNNHWKKLDRQSLLINKEEQQLVLSNISHYS